MVKLLLWLVENTISQLWAHYEKGCSGDVLLIYFTAGKITEEGFFEATEKMYCHRQEIVTLGLYGNCNLLVRVQQEK